MQQRSKIHHVECFLYGIMLTIKCFQFLVLRNKVEKLKKREKNTFCNYVIRPCSNFTNLRNFKEILRNFRAFSKEFENLIVRTLYTEGRLLGFSYDFSVTRNSSSNADAMVVASARLRGIHPLIIFKMADVQGPWRQHFDDES
jgi:hypothetical protein